VCKPGKEKNDPCQEGYKQFPGERKMKKIIASAVGLMLVGGVAVTTAQAVESQFGGYWRTRFTYSDNMGVVTPATSDKKADNNTNSWYRTDSRTRLYYTAKFNDDFKFINKFEFNTNWGNTSTTTDFGGGGVGADGKGNFRIKNSYADFTLGMLNSKVGIMGNTLARGFLFADDFSGVVEQINLDGTQNSGTRIQFGYMAVENEGDNITNKGDQNIYFISPYFDVNDKIRLNPHATYWYETGTDTSLFYGGIDADLTFDAFSAWITTVYNGGEINNNDVSAYLLAAGAEAGIVHGQAFFATGDNSDPTERNSGDFDGFVSLPGQSYYWSEIMGLGTFDQQKSNGSPGDKISNVAAFNVGVTLMPMDKMTLTLDAWYAFLDRDDKDGNDQLGLELDGKLSYKLMDNLNADLIAAYLIADDATGDDDVFEGGLQLSLKF
jgi:hypothetical protein